MFYICNKREDGKFGIMNTQEGVIDYYTPKQIIKYVTKAHIDIKGVYKKESGNWGIRILKPTSFTEVDSNIDIEDNSSNII